MATSLRPPFSPFALRRLSPTGHRRHSPLLAVRCGPRDNRGPLMKGRILSIEAIHAIQTLKHAYTTNHKSNEQLDGTLTRLIKSDLLAVLNELLRQGHCDLSLRVFSVVRSEPGYSPDLATYAALVRALASSGDVGEIDRLIEELEAETADCGGLQWGDEKSLVKLIRALIEAQRRESTVRIYGMMKRSGWGVEGSGVAMDEYAAKVVGRGLRVLGEAAMAEEVQAAYQSYLKAGGGLQGVGAA